MTGASGVVSATPTRRRPGAPAARTAAGARASATAARVGLLVLAGTGAWLAFAAASDGAIVDTSSAAEPDWARGLLRVGLPGLNDVSLSLLLLAMLAGYAAAVAWAGTLPERPALSVVLGLIVLFGLAPPLLSSDVFGYVAYARLDVLHGINPYLHGPIAAPHDAALPLVYWRHAASPYGPLFTLLSLPAGAVSIAAAVWSVKIATTLACLLAVVLVARAAPAYGRSPLRSALLVGGNPLLLAYGVGGAHNDVVVMAVAAAGILLLARERRPASGAAALVLATGLKVTGGLLLPFALAASAERRRFTAGAIAAGGVALALTVAVFGTKLGGTIGRIATDRAFAVPWSGPYAVGRLLGTGLTSGVRVGCAAAALASGGACLWRVHRGADWLGMAAAAGLAVMCAIPSLTPWYVAWVLPAAALARGRWVPAAMVFATGLIIFTRLPILGFAAY